MRATLHKCKKTCACKWMVPTCGALQIRMQDTFGWHVIAINLIAACISRQCRKCFQSLLDHGMLKPSLTVIHALALRLIDDTVDEKNLSTLVCTYYDAEIFELYFTHVLEEMERSMDLYKTMIKRSKKNKKCKKNKNKEEYEMDIGLEELCVTIEQLYDSDGRLKPTEFVFQNIPWIEHLQFDKIHILHHLFNILKPFGDVSIEGLVERKMEDLRSEFECLISCRDSQTLEQWPRYAEWFKEKVLLIKSYINMDELREMEATIRSCPHPEATTFSWGE